jgi:fructose-1,6-bisphosphatase I
MRNMITMGEFIVKKQADYPTATGELTSCSAPSAWPPRW